MFITYFTMDGTIATARFTRYFVSLPGSRGSSTHVVIQFGWIGRHTENKPGDCNDVISRECIHPCMCNDSQEQLVCLLLGITIPSHERTSTDRRTIVATGNNGHVHVVRIDIENGHNLFRGMRARLPCLKSRNIPTPTTVCHCAPKYCRTNYVFRNYRLDSLASIDPTLSDSSFS
jgi:hypothetical protein